MRNYIVKVVYSFFNKIGRQRDIFLQFILLFVAFGMVLSPVLQAQNVSVFVDPSLSVVKHNDTLTVRIKYDDGGAAHNLRGYSITFTFDPSILIADVDDVTEGGFLKSIGETRYYELNNGGGSITVESALLDGTGGLNGSGTLFSVRFKSKSSANGSSPVSLTNVTLRDYHNNDISADAADGTITIQPYNVLSFSAMPGHKKVTLNWLNPDGFYKVKIMRRAWGDTYPDNYPEYGGSAPSYPLMYSDAVTQGWTEVYDGNSDTYEDTPLNNRNIYYYAAYAYDDAASPNFADGTTSSRDRATSYYLGDFHDDAITIPPSVPWNPDGYVEFNDLSIFSLTYYKTVTPGAGEWWNVCDIGPTDPPSGTQYWLNPPDPDGKIDFEDLMVFSNIWHTVVPKAVIPIDEQRVAGRELAVSIKEVNRVRFSEGSFAVHINLQNDGTFVKGIKAVIQYDSQRMKLISVKKGQFLRSQPYPVFFKYADEGDYLQINAAVLGRNIGMSGSGSVADIVFENYGSDNFDVTIKEIDLRGIKNNSLIPDVYNKTEDTEIPKQFFISQNFPNPFNSSTVMQYRLPESCRVELSIYNSIGQEVCILVNEFRNAGIYKTQWNGIDNKGAALPSGMYFMNFHAGSFYDVKKIILLR